ncbi:MAG: low specificity L-threonine aldolase [Bacteroidales bacterium]|nr:low specificity L-threonine aldolase [Bacteroidales bacterium]
MLEINPHSFASDNCSGVHPDILQKLADVNHGHVPPYGTDIYCIRATTKLIDTFGDNVVPYVAYNGTAANVLALQAITQRHSAIICAETAHINVDECGAPERHTGCKLLTVATPNGKLTPELVAKHMHGFGSQHHAQPRAISISQPTELGTVYTPDELCALANYAHQHGLRLHMDGARLANAAASLGLSLRQITGDVGVDVLSFGGTKNGMMYGEAIVFFAPELAADFQYIRKQGLQLASKMRFVAAQFIAYLDNQLYLRTAQHANQMAQRLAERLRQVPQVQITQPVQSNAVFATIPVQITDLLQREFAFYIWDEARNEVRWMTSWDTTEADIDRFVNTIKQLLDRCA